MEVTVKVNVNQGAAGFQIMAAVRQAMIDAWGDGDYPEDYARFVECEHGGTVNIAL